MGFRRAPSRVGQALPHCHSEIIRLALSARDREMLKNVSALGRYMKKFLEEQIGSAPKDPGAIEEMLRVLLQRVR